MKDLMDTRRSFQTRNPLSLEQVHELLRQRVDPGLGEPTLKKGLFSKAIVYPKVARVTPRISIKDTKVKVIAVTDSSKTTVSVGGFTKVMDKDLQGVAGIDTAKQGSAYFRAVADAVTNALADQ
ncbi:MAG: hypothetical protein GXX86_07615 [Propionibacterium sp.]|nr:hypothetical protein [Propionibacterium sp.]